MAFSDNLRQLPSVAHIAALRLLDESGNEVASIPNAPGKTGSLTVYAALAAKHSAINEAAAREGLELFAEHTEDAQKHPGKHPNIDRLLDVIAGSKSLKVEIVPQA